MRFPISRYSGGESNYLPGTLHRRDPKTEDLFTMRISILILTFACLLVSGCGGDAETASNLPATADEQSEVDDPKGETSDSTPVGSWGRSGGIMLRVDGTKESKTVRYKGGTQDSDVTPDGEAVTKKAKQGGSYVYVTSTVKNDSNNGIDLTCGLPIEANLVDRDGREFTLVEGTYLIGDNPGCNDILDPGFKANMTWVFLVPPGAEPASLNFSDTTDINSEAPTKVMALK